MLSYLSGPDTSYLLSTGPKGPDAFTALWGTDTRGGMISPPPGMVPYTTAQGVTYYAPAPVFRMEQVRAPGAGDMLDMAPDGTPAAMPQKSAPLLAPPPAPSGLAAVPTWAWLAAVAALVLIKR
jgi:hypothetical protein